LSWEATERNTGTRTLEQLQAKKSDADQQKEYARKAMQVVRRVHFFIYFTIFGPKYEQVPIMGSTNRNGHPIY
jgi:hypothetical protein